MDRGQKLVIYLHPGYGRYPLAKGHVCREDGVVRGVGEVCIDMFLEHGFKYFDTSYIYHDRKAELALRECLVKRHPRDSYILSDKLPVKFVYCKEDVERIFNEQLEKCGVEYFD